MDLIGQAGRAIRAHQLMACRRSAAVTEQLGAMKADVLARVREAFEAGRDELVDAAVEAAGLAIPGWGLLADWLLGAGRAFRRHRTEQHLLATTQDVGAGLHRGRIDAAGRPPTSSWGRSTSRSRQWSSSRTSIRWVRTWCPSWNDCSPLGRDVRS